MPRYPGFTAPSGPEVTDDPLTAARLVTEGRPVVLVSADATALGAVLAGAPDRGGRRRLLAVLVGDPGDPAVRAAAVELAEELARDGAADGAGGGAGR